MSEEEKEDVLFQIDMKLYDEFNDKFCEMNEHLGDIYSYKDIEELEKIEKETERKLLREAIVKLQKEIKKQKEDINKLITYIAVREDKDYEEVRKEFDI